jgi:hypothetical protein
MFLNQLGAELGIPSALQLPDLEYIKFLSRINIITENSPILMAGTILDFLKAICSNLFPNSTQLHAILKRAEDHFKKQPLGRTTGLGGGKGSPRRGRIYEVTSSKEPSNCIDRIP